MDEMTRIFLCLFGTSIRPGKYTLCGTFGELGATKIQNCNIYKDGRLSIVCLRSLPSLSFHFRDGPSLLFVIFPMSLASDVL